MNIFILVQMTDKLNKELNNNSFRKYIAKIDAKFGYNNQNQQVGSIEQINEQTRRMAEQIEELNGIYARMIKALTVNMKNAAGVQNEA